jgi:CheY-like chemotaxis protein
MPGKGSFEEQPTRAVADRNVAILVAEDNPKDTFLLKRAFSQWGIRVPVIFVSDGQEVIDYLSAEPPFDDRNANPWPGLVVLDLAMPKVSGFEVLAWMRRHLATSVIPVLVCSSVARQPDIQCAYALGADFLQKSSDENQWADNLYQVAAKYGLTDPMPGRAGRIAKLPTDPSATKQAGPSSPT